ncbi:MAG: lyase family protein, partial [Polyangiaceae bacterium]
MSKGNGPGARIERDTMGEMSVPATALWGAGTQRAVLNFPISDKRFPRRFIKALGLIKKAAAQTNGELNLVPPNVVEAIVDAAQEVADGRLDEHFVLDIFQTGSGTSTNMNANEVIATLAGDGVHANDDVNMGQSSNDVFPSAVHLAALDRIVNDLLPALEQLAGSLEAKAREFDDVVKSGRTHWMDAVPVTL